MVTKAEKIFFSVIIAFILGTAIFWKEMRTFLSGSSQSGPVTAKEKKPDNVEDATAGSATPALQRWTLASSLNEISGLVAVGDDLWAVSDNPKQPVMKLDGQGNVVQELTLQGVSLEDAEAMASDGTYLYIGDVGDNKGNRAQRSIYRVPLAAIGNASKATVQADVITFAFDGQTIAEKKKENEFDCEAMFFHNGELYLFTKRRTDKDTELFKLPARPGHHTATSMGVSETNGMVTGAAINAAGTEVVLTGYHKGHTSPFLLFLKEFTGNKFFEGGSERVELAREKTDWQVESITYAKNDRLYFANEKTKDVPATLYRINRPDVSAVNQKEK